MYSKKINSKHTNIAKQNCCFHCSPRACEIEKPLSHSTM